MAVKKRPPRRDEGLSEKDILARIEKGGSIPGLSKATQPQSKLGEESKAVKPKPLHKQKPAKTATMLRCEPVLLEYVDASCHERAGKVSRNTWIIEAIEEKLARERR